MEALHDVVRAGKARYIGASSMYAWRFAKAQAVAERRGWTRFVSMQNHYNLIYREEEREMIPQCIDQGVGRHAVEPAGARAPRRQPPRTTRAADRARRRPTGSRTRSTIRDAGLAVVERLGEVASAGVPPAQIALAWLLAKPGVTAPIVGATKVEHIEDALAAEELAADQGEDRRLEEPYVPHPVLGSRTVRVLVLQHIACEPPGVYEDVLRERGAELHRVELDKGEPLPDGASSTRSSPWAGR